MTTISRAYNTHVRIVYIVYVANVCIAGCGFMVTRLGHTEGKDLAPSLGSSAPLLFSRGDVAEGRPVTLGCKAEAAQVMKPATKAHLPR